MIVMKFGGTSLANGSSIRQVTKIVQQQLRQRPLLVVSACGDTTDQLISLADAALRGRINLKDFRGYYSRLMDELQIEPSIIEKLLNKLETVLKGIAQVRELTPRTQDYVLSFGERLAVRIVGRYLKQQGMPAQARDAYDIGMITDSSFGNATPLPEAYRLIQRRLKYRNVLPVITGYIGKDKHGNITTLGRNGSDYSACIIGAALGVKEVQIWSDRDGIMTTDPQVVPRARTLTKISFNEACELAYYSRRFHPSALVPAMRIPIRVLNTFNPACPGTTILNRTHTPQRVKAVVCKTDLYLVNIVSTRMLLYAGFLQRVWEIFGRYQIVIDMIATSEVSISVTTDSAKNLDKAIRQLSHFAEVTCTPRKAIVSVIGENLKQCPGLVKDVFAALQRNHISAEMISQGASRINLTFLVNNREAAKAVRVVHKLLIPAR